MNLPLRICSIAFALVLLLAAYRTMFQRPIISTPIAPLAYNACVKNTLDGLGDRDARLISGVVSEVRYFCHYSSYPAADRKPKPKLTRLAERCLEDYALLLKSMGRPPVIWWVKDEGDVDPVICDVEHGRVRAEHSF